MWQKTDQKTPEKKSPKAQVLETPKTLQNTKTVFRQKDVLTLDVYVGWYM